MRLAVVQPRSASGAAERANVDGALDWLDRAAAAGADLVVFPECYPGPANPISTHDGIGPLAARAAQHGLHVVASAIEPTLGGRSHHVTLYLIDDAGETVGVYRRTTPDGPYIYRDIPAWEFDYVAGADEPHVFETRIGRIGMLVCSEVYVPELSRVLALKGADLIVYPAGGSINELRGAWQTVIHARAIENLLYTAACQNLYADHEQGLAMIASPEAVLARRADEGLLVADLDLARTAYLREQHERITFPKPYATVPGLLRWRRPELYRELLADPGERASDALARA